MMRRNLTARGDTIVEVLVAITVVSVILTSSFTVVNRTAQNVRQTEEHGIALKLLEGQIEQLKAISASPVESLKVFGRTTPKAFCLQNGLAVDTNGADTLPQSDRTKYGTCQATDGITYYYGVIEAVGGNTFTATASWDGPRGTQDNVQLVYKVYRP